MPKKPHILIATIAASLLGGGALGQSEWRRALERFQRDLGGLYDDLTFTKASNGQRYGLFVPGPEGAGAHIKTWRALGDRRAPSSAVVLVHGLDEPGDIWDDLAPELVGAGHEVIRFEYANDQRVHTSAAEFVGALRAAREAGVEDVVIIAHSMGGLVSFDALTADSGYAGRVTGVEGLPDVTRLITVGTPWTGSPWARMRKVAEVRDQVQRWLTDDSWDIRPILNPDLDGRGQAGDDLAEGSDLVNELMSREMPEGLPLTVLVGRIAPARPGDLAWLEDSSVLRDIFGGESVERFAADLTGAGGRLGDGAVPIESALARDAEDTMIFEANHRGMVRRSPIDFATGTGEHGPPGIPVILERLARD